MAESAPNKLKTKKIVKKVVPIKQTVTSVLRMVKSNPVLLLQSRTDQIEGVKLPLSVFKHGPKVFSESVFGSSVKGLEKAKKNSCNAAKKRTAWRSPKCPLPIPVADEMDTTAKANTDLPSNFSKLHVSRENAERNRDISNKTSKRRSLSAQHYERKKSEERAFLKRVNLQSLENISSISSPIGLKTPAKKQVLIFLPASVHEEMKDHLYKWLKRHRKPYNSFNSLQNISQDLNHKQVTSKTKEMLSKALNELEQLILAGEFPSNKSEEWLQKVRNHNRFLEDISEYWECKAAIERSKGNITSAVEYYRSAIVSGAAINKIDSNLDKLLSQFSLLNLSVSQKCGNVDERTRIILDARNAFKSSIIQYAIKEKDSKRMKIFATSSNTYSSTPCN